MSDTLATAEPCDLADPIAFALRFEDRKRFHQADEYMAAIAAERCARPGASPFRRYERLPEIGGSSFAPVQSLAVAAIRLARNRSCKNSFARFQMPRALLEARFSGWLGQTEHRLEALEPVLRLRTRDT
jgi:hypothetical protein